MLIIIFLKLVIESLNVYVFKAIFFGGGFYQKPVEHKDTWVIHHKKCTF